MNEDLKERRERLWLIYSREHNGWWRPNSSGYTRHMDQAGRYTKIEAESRCDDAAIGRGRHGDEGPPEFMVPDPVALEAAERVNKGIEEAADKLAEHYSNLQRDFKLGIEVATRGLSKRAEAAEGERDRLRDALEPFAIYADPREKMAGSLVITQGSKFARRQLTMQDCYRARAALTPEHPDKASGEAPRDLLSPEYDPESGRWVCHSCGRNSWFMREIKHAPGCPFAQQETEG